MNIMVNKIIKFAVINFILLTIINPFILCPASGDGNGNWVMFRHDIQHSGHQPLMGRGNLSNYGIIWYKNFEKSWIYGEPIIGNIDLAGDKEIIFGNDKGYVYCLDAYGNVSWKFECGSESTSFFGG